MKLEDEKMLKVIEKIFSVEQSRFIVVGIMNTIIGTAAMLVCYNFLHMGYWASSAMDYVIGSIFSYFANKYFTFQMKKKSGAEAIRFVINILVCYFLSYGIARPFIDLILKELSLSRSLMDQISMLFGTGIFIVFNYFGQKFFVFRK